jgi:hypothetical protein
MSSSKPPRRRAEHHHTTATFESPNHDAATALGPIRIHTDPALRSTAAVGISPSAARRVAMTLTALLFLPSPLDGHADSGGAIRQRRLADSRRKNQQRRRPGMVGHRVADQRAGA